MICLISMIDLIELLERIIETKGQLFITYIIFITKIIVRTIDSRRVRALRIVHET